MYCSVVLNASQFLLVEATRALSGAHAYNGQFVPWLPWDMSREFYKLQKQYILQTWNVSFHNLVSFNPLWYTAAQPRHLKSRIGSNDTMQTFRKWWLYCVSFCLHSQSVSILPPLVCAAHSVITMNVHHLAQFITLLLHTIVSCNQRDDMHARLSLLLLSCSAQHRIFLISIFCMICSQSVLHDNSSRHAP